MEQGFVGSRVTPALEERTLGGGGCVGGLGACPPRNFLDFRPSEIVAGNLGRNTRPHGRRTCCAMLGVAY